MFFFIGGIQPKTKRISNTPRLCPFCGHYVACQERVDYYLSLFFIPIFPVRQGAAFFRCERCNRIFDDEGVTDATSVRQCRHCGKDLSGDFAFCPYCGKRTGY